MKESTNYECAAEIRDAITQLERTVDAIAVPLDVRPILAAIMLASVSRVVAPPNVTLADRVRGAVGTADLILDYCAANPRKE